MNNLFIYEAGSLTYLKQINQFNKATEWRNKLDQWAKENNCKTFNPAKTFEIEKAHEFSGAIAVKQNDFYLARTNIMIVQMDYLDKSPGTQYELTTYKQLYPNKPVIAFAEDKNNLFYWSPHISSCIADYCENINTVIDLLSVMFSQSMN